MNWTLYRKLSVSEWLTRNEWALIAMKTYIQIYNYLLKLVVKVRKIVVSFLLNVFLLKYYFHCITWILMHATGSHFRSHNSMLPVQKKTLSYVDQWRLTFPISVFNKASVSWSFIVSGTGQGIYCSKISRCILKSSSLSWDLKQLWIPNPKAKNDKFVLFLLKFSFNEFRNQSHIHFVCALIGSPLVSKRYINPS